MNKNPERGSLAIIFLFVVLLVGVGVGAYYYGKGNLRLPTTKQTTSPSAQVSPTPSSAANETANWRTYTNNDFKFSFQYPTTWKLETSGNQLGLESPDISAEFQEPTSGALFYIEMNPLTDPVDDVKTLSELAISTDTMTVSEKRETTFQTKLAVYYKAKNSTEAEINGLNLGLNNGFLRILLYNYGRNAENQRSLDQILSTFKFTN